jgi:anti-anti-sigma factor
MEISQRQEGDLLHVAVAGRLDANWAEHFSTVLQEAVREGAYHLRIHMADVTYMSSIGVRVLLKFYKEMQRLEGSFAVCDPSRAVEEVLELSGLDALLRPAAGILAPVVARAPARQLQRCGVEFDVFECEAAAPMRCDVLGNPERLQGFRFGAQDCYSIAFPEDTFGLGLGALGDRYESCRDRFGEFLAVGGAAAYLPTDGANVPDQVVSTGDLVPEVQALYALSIAGSFSHLLRFDAGDDRGSLPLTEIVGAAFEATTAPVIGVVVVAECAGLVGAALRRSPIAGKAGDDLFGHPGIRAWISFTPERAYPRSLCVAVGVAARERNDTLAPYVRPLGENGSLSGHIHAAAFSYLPLQKGAVDLKATVAAIFETQTLQCVLHLLTDDREGVGAGESDLVRGACWAGAIKEIRAGRGHR